VKDIHITYFGSIEEHCFSINNEKITGQIHWPVLPVISHSPLFWQYTGTHGSKV
jgi:hypothetical protein